MFSSLVIVIIVVITIAVVVGQYDFIEGASARNTRVRVYTPRGKKEQGKLALSMAIKSLDFFEDYFQVMWIMNLLLLSLLCIYLSTTFTQLTDTLIILLEMSIVITLN